MHVKALADVVSGMQVLPVKRTLMEKASQVGIFAGALALLLTGSGSRWGFVMGLSVQPFWFYTSIKHRQWGIVAASVIYATGWSIGIYRNFSVGDFTFLFSRILSAVF
jgi:hypothetical protein